MGAFAEAHVGEAEETNCGSGTAVTRANGRGNET